MESEGGESMNQSRTTRLTGIAGFLLTMLLLCTVVLSGGLTVSAAKSYTFTLEQQEDIKVMITYQGTAPKLTLKTGETTYQNDKDYAKVEKAEGLICLYIKEAPSGKWTISSDQEIKFTVMAWLPPIQVDSFSYSAPKSDRITVKTKVQSDREESFSWSIYAVSDNDITGFPMKLLLRETSGTTNKESSTEVSTKTLPDGKWTLTMEARVNRGDGLESDANAEGTTSFNITGHTKEGDASLIKVSVDSTDHIVYVDWSAIQDYYGTMLVTATNAKGEVVCREEHPSEIRTTRIVSDSDLTLRLMPYRGDENEVKYVRQISAAGPATVTIDTAESTSDLMVTISYQAGDQPVKADVTINGVNASYQLKGSGTLSLPLEQMSSNQVSVTTYSDKGDSYTVSKEITLLNQPLYIRFYGIQDVAVTTDEKMSVSGTTAPGASLKLNDSPVTVSENGDFTAEATLQPGENLLTFTIQGSNGVQTMRSLKVIRTEVGGSAADVKNDTSLPSWAGLVFGGGAAIIALGMILLTLLLMKKKHPSKGRAVLMWINSFLLLCTLLFAGAGTWCLLNGLRVTRSISGSKLVDRLRDNDYDGIDGILRARDTWNDRMIAMYVIAGICLAVLITLLVVQGVVRSKRKKNSAPVSEPETKPNTKKNSEKKVKEKKPKAPKQKDKQ